MAIAASPHRQSVTPLRDQFSATLPQALPPACPSRIPDSRPCPPTPHRFLLLPCPVLLPVPGTSGRDKKALHTSKPRTIQHPGRSEADPSLLAAKTKSYASRYPPIVPALPWHHRKFSLPREHLLPRSLRLRPFPLSPDPYRSPQRFPHSLFPAAVSISMPRLDRFRTVWL